MQLLRSVLTLLGVWQAVRAQDSFSAADSKAQVNITHAGECSDAYLDLRGVQVNTYRSAIAFNRDSVRIDPPNPVIPGCMTFTVDVTVGTDITGFFKNSREKVNRPLRDITAQIEMRMTGVPDPSVPTLPCGKPPDADTRCKCGDGEDSCLFCGFCNNLKRKELKSVNVFSKSAGRQKNVDSILNSDQCDCGVVSPGTYTLSAEVCTPPEEELTQHVPIEMQKRIYDGKPISLFIAVYLYNFHFEDSDRLLSPLGQLIFLRRKATGTVGCYLIGTNVMVDSSLATGGVGPLQ